MFLFYNNHSTPSLKEKKQSQTTMMFFFLSFPLKMEKKIRIWPKKVLLLIICWFIIWSFYYIDHFLYKKSIHSYDTTMVKVYIFCKKNQNPLIIFIFFLNIIPNLPFIFQITILWRPKIWRRKIQKYGTKHGTDRNPYFKNP